MRSTLITFLSLVAFIRCATIVPRIDSSSVNVKKSGQDYSYTIHEKHGVGIEPLPLIKVRQSGENYLLAPEIESDQQQMVPLEQKQQQQLIQQQKQLQYQQQQQQEEEMIKEFHLKPVMEPQFQAIPVPISVPAITYLPAYHYGINYPYNVILSSY